MPQARAGSKPQHTASCINIWAIFPPKVGPQCWPYKTVKIETCPSRLVGCHISQHLSLSLLLRPHLVPWPPHSSCLHLSSCLLIWLVVALPSASPPHLVPTPPGASVSFSRCTPLIRLICCITRCLCLLYRGLLCVVLPLVTLLPPVRLRLLPLVCGLWQCLVSSTAALAAVSVLYNDIFTRAWLLGGRESKWMVCNVSGTLLAWYIEAKEPVVRNSCENYLHKIYVDHVLFTLGTSFGNAMQK